MRFAGVRVMLCNKNKRNKNATERTTADARDLQRTKRRRFTLELSSTEWEQPNKREHTGQENYVYLEVEGKDNPIALLSLFSKYTWRFSNFVEFFIRGAPGKPPARRATLNQIFRNCVSCIAESSMTFVVLAVRILALRIAFPELFWFFVNTAFCIR